MDARRFDALARTLHTSGTRRALSGALGMLVGFLALIGVDAPHDAGARKKKRKKQVTIEGPCGNGSAKKNRCKRDRQCCTNYCKKGRCRCRKLNQSCSEDRNCCPDRTGRTCQEGTCQPAPTCIGPEDPCSDSLPCCESLSCQEGTCLPALCAELCLDGCCAGEDCQAGDSDDACGTDGEACQACGTHEICESGACVCIGDVCAEGCPYTTIQDAIDDPLGPGTIHLCPETYTETITIDRNLTLIGAGQGADGTILDGDKSGSVVTVITGVTAELRALRITGGEGNGGGEADGGGIYNSGTLILTNTTVTGNQAGDDAAGIYNNQGTVTLNNSTVSLNVGTNDGGGFYNDEGIINLNNSFVTENSAGWGGGLFNASVGDINLVNSHVTFNTAGGAGQGGGIFNGDTITVDATSTIVDNTPDDCAGPGSGCP